MVNIFEDVHSSILELLKLVCLSYTCSV